MPAIHFLLLPGVDAANFLGDLLRHFSLDEHRQRTEKVVGFSIQGMGKDGNMIFDYEEIEEAEEGLTTFNDSSSRTNIIR